MQPTYESLSFSLISLALTASILIAPLAAYMGGYFKQMLGEGDAFEGERAAQVAAAFLLALLTTVGYGADSVAPPAWVSVLCVVAAYSPVLWLAVRAARCACSTAEMRQPAAIA
ncbi:hypothetical protein [Cupriavidus sp. TMH.W2]|uniref:hypothetical protein n=1 Tax=Cupriavidus sp. TMH.W2 TaxID=3434465 RepID=UPI003D7715CE